MLMTILNYIQRQHYFNIEMHLTDVLRLIQGVHLLIFVEFFMHTITTELFSLSYHLTTVNDCRNATPLTLNDVRPQVPSYT